MLSVCMYMYHMDAVSVVFYHVLGEGPAREDVHDEPVNACTRYIQQRSSKLSDQSVLLLMYVCVCT